MGAKAKPRTEKIKRKKKQNKPSQNKKEQQKKRNGKKRSRINLKACPSSGYIEPKNPQQ